MSTPRAPTTTAMSVPDPPGSSRRRAHQADAACYRETVRLLESLSKRHRDALEEFAGSSSTARFAKAAPTARAHQLGERVVRLEDAAVEALAGLARVSDYEDALAAMQESGSAVWLWGTVLSRAVEATDVARVSGKR